MTRCGGGERPKHQISWAFLGTWRLRRSGLCTPRREEGGYVSDSSTRVRIRVRTRGRWFVRFSAVSTRRKDLEMSVTQQLGFDEPGGGLLAQGNRWWAAGAREHPVLQVVGDLAELP